MDASYIASHYGWCSSFTSPIELCNCGGYTSDARKLFAKLAGEAEPKQQEMAVIQDFDGVVDGAGVKGVMTAPKLPLELITPEILKGLAEVLKHGAKKYAPNNWMRGMSWETVMGGVLRHLTAFRAGEELDPESNLPHLHHAACGLMFLSWYSNGPSSAQHQKFDDRKYKEAQ